MKVELPYNQMREQQIAREIEAMAADTTSAKIDWHLVRQSKERANNKKHDSYRRRVQIENRGDQKWSPRFPDQTLP